MYNQFYSINNTNIIDFNVSSLIGVFVIVFLGLISTKGLTFRKGTEKHTMVSAGPLTKYAEDLTPVIKALIGPEKSLEMKIGQEVGFYLIISTIFAFEILIFSS